MNRFYLILIVLLTVILYRNIENFMQFYNILISIILIETCVVIIEAYNYFLSRKPEFLWKFLYRIKIYKIKREFDLIFEKGREEDLYAEYIRMALIDLSSVEQKKKLSALQQLQQLGDEPKNIEVIYLGLIKALENEPDERFKDSIVGAICYFRKSRNKDYRSGRK